MTSQEIAEWNGSLLGIRKSLYQDEIQARATVFTANSRKCPKPGGILMAMSSSPLL
ncbi:MAG: hypothetical protein NVSMB39_2580 [Candidatus Saccharimonadales bacterium]